MAPRPANGAPGLVAISNSTLSLPEGPAWPSGRGWTATRKRALSSFSGASSAITAVVRRPAAAVRAAVSAPAAAA